MTWSRETSDGNEQDKIAAFVIPYTRGRGLDIGCALGRKCWPHMLGYDRIPSPTVDIVGEADDLSMFADGAFDFVFSSHTLEDLVDTRETLIEWWRVIKPGGHLVLYLPHKDFYPNIGEEGANPAHKHDFLPDDIIEHMDYAAEVCCDGWTLVENETRTETNEYSFFQVYRKEGPSRRVIDPWKRDIGKPRALVVRFGAIGDMIMASSILPGLEEQGYHITMATTPAGLEVVRHNPHISDFWVQDKDQVPQLSLEAYLRSLATRFDRVVNLCESVESSLLLVKGRPNHWLDLPARRRLVGHVNYLERQHDIAGVPYDGFGGARFYPTAEERADCHRERSVLGPMPVVYWVLSGTSMHKTWPYAPVVIGWLLQRTNATIVLVGGQGERDLAYMVQTALDHDDTAELLGSAAPVDLGRLYQRVGNWSVRDALTFIEEVDCIVGPETGILNAAAMLPVPKVVMLSHSSHDNLTKHWHKTVVLEPVDCPCFPCHALHMTWEDCHQVESLSSALCAANIKPEVVYDAITFALGLESRMKLASD